MTFAEAREHLKGVIYSDDGGLYHLGWYVNWSPRDLLATLDGEFSADDLEAIAVYMRGEEPR